MPLIFLRHTQPDVKSGICYGKTDLEPAASFNEDCKKVLATLPQFDRIFSSPLERCRKLAAVISNSRGVPFTVEARLREMDFGRWEMQAWSDLPRAQLDEWAKDFAHAKPHGGESVAQLNARISELIETLQSATLRTLLVTHAGVIKAAFAHDLAESSHRLETEFGCFHVLDPQPGAATSTDRVL